MIDSNEDPDFTLVIIGRETISDEVIKAIREAIDNYCGYLPKTNRLGNVAAEYAVFAKDPSLLSTLKKRFSINEIDFNIVENSNRKKKLILADMDATLIANECIDELAAYVGLKDKISVITERTMQGEIKFEQSLIERVALLKGLPTAALQDIYDQSICLNPGAKILGKTLASYGVKTAIVSGGFDFFTNRIAKDICFGASFSNRLEIENNTLTGRVLPPIMGPTAKRDTLMEHIQKDNILISQTLCVGDGANDIEMIKAAGTGVAYHAKTKLTEVSDCIINFADLTGLLYLQGYRQEDFTE